MNNHQTDSVSILLPDLSWKQNQPISNTFQDVYFSTQNGFEETEHVFLKGNTLKERWQKRDSSKTKHFTIIETGFGTGLNLLCAWLLWEEVAPPHHQLHYISVEKFPLKTVEISKALSNWPILSEKSRELVTKYPVLTPGMHRIKLAEGKVHLTLGWGDVNNILPRIQAKADAWFLDGFSPSKNPEMWSELLFKQMYRLSQTGTTFSTFTSASLVRKGIAETGFSVAKTKGFGKKREMLTGVLRAKNSKNLYNAIYNPWFRRDKGTQNQNRQAVVIGGGIAGVTSAFTLSDRGFKVELIEQNGQLAQEASGNPTGALFTKLNPTQSIQNYFYQQSYFHAVRHLQQLSKSASARETLNWQQCGMLQLDLLPKEQSLQRHIVDSCKWPEEVIQVVDAKQASQLSGIQQSRGGLFLPQSGWVNPASLCHALIRCANGGITVHYQQQALRLFQDSDKRWHILNQHNQVITSADTVVIANAENAKKIAQTQHLPLKTIRGQISIAPATAASASLRTILNYDGYTIPEYNGYHCLGATFHPKDSYPHVRKSDDETNLKKLEIACPELYRILTCNGQSQSVQGRTAFRCQTPDYLPIVGPVPILESYIQKYAGLRTGRLKENYPTGDYYEGLFVNIAYGSRGLTSAPLCADILLSHINDEPQPIEADVINALHPARFIIRNLKRRLI